MIPGLIVLGGLVWQSVEVATGKPMSKSEDFVWLSITAVWVALAVAYRMAWKAASR